MDETRSTEGLVSGFVLELAEEIKEKGRRSTRELPPLLQKAEQLAQDETQRPLIRALAFRAAGNALQLLHQFEPALDRYNRATDILESLDEPTELGRTLLSKVGFLFYLSRFDELFECAQRARTLLERAGDRQRLGRLDVNLAHAYFRLDRYNESLECSERALLTLEEIGDKEGILGATINSAAALSLMHEFERAEQHFQTALRLAEELNIPAWARVSRYNLALLGHRRGNAGEALRVFATLRREYEEAGEQRQLCLCWLDEAEILLEIGDFEETIHAARQARDLAEKLRLNSEIGRSFLFEAAAGLRLGLQEEALDLLAKATQRFESEGNTVLTAVSKLQTALFRGERGEPSALDEAVAARSVLMNSGLPHRLALAEIVVGRIRRFLGDKDAAIDSFRSAQRVAEASRSEWMQFHAYYELGVSLLEDSASESTQLFRKAETMLDSVWNRLGSDDLKMAFLGDRENVYTYLVKAALPDSAEAAFEFSEKARSRILRERLVQGPFDKSLANFHSQLSPDETVVEYFITGNDLAIFTVNSDRIECVHRRGAVSKLKEECVNLERHLSSCSIKWERLRAVHRQLETTALSHLQYLYKELVEPVRSRLRQSLIFAPHGFLHGIPFHALHDHERFLLDTHQISYSPSASLYCAPPPHQRFEAPLFVAFSRNKHLTSISEVEEVAQNFPGAAVLANPSIADLAKAFDVPRSLIHIAGHAGIDMVRGCLSWIETPEGRLTSRDLADMQIRAKSLVITGCQTARRMIQPGDEWLGLMRALYMSGASSIVAAFWDIRDETARHFSTEFYKHFDGSNAPSAVQKACAAVRNRQTHPYFWAGFGAFVRKNS